MQLPCPDEFCSTFVSRIVVCASSQDTIRVGEIGAIFWKKLTCKKTSLPSIDFKRFHGEESRIEDRGASAAPEKYWQVGGQPNHRC